MWGYTKKTQLDILFSVRKVFKKSFHLNIPATDTVSGFSGLMLWAETNPTLHDALINLWIVVCFINQATKTDQSKNDYITCTDIAHEDEWSAAIVSNVNINCCNNSNHELIDWRLKLMLLHRCIHMISAQGTNNQHI